MGKEVRGVPEAASLTSAESIGRYLAGQRRLRGISLDELAECTRIPIRSLERLEAGAFDEHVDGFARSFVRTVAEALGLDPHEAVARLLAEPTEVEGPAAAAGRAGRRARLAAIAVVSLAVLAFWLLWLRASDAPTEPEAARAVGTAPASEIVTRRDAVRALAERQGAAQRP